MDFNDTEALASLFTEDGILQLAKGQLRGRAAILKSTKERAREEKDRAAKDTSGMRPAAHRHFVSNLVLQIDGDKAVGTAYWCHIGSATADRKPVYMTYGHYEDEFVKVNGKWFFKFRTFSNEQSDRIFYKKGVNPAP